MAESIQPILAKFNHDQTPNMNFHTKCPFLDIGRLAQARCEEASLQQLAEVRGFRLGLVCVHCSPCAQAATGPSTCSRRREQGSRDDEMEQDPFMATIASRDDGMDQGFIMATIMGTSASSRGFLSIEGKYCRPVSNI